jgi:hypothetical protein
VKYGRLDILRRRIGADRAAAMHIIRDRTMTNGTGVHASASVPTASGGKYMRQLCKHWAHNLAVEQDGDHATVRFPRDARGADFPGDGLATFDATPEALEVRIDATSAEQLEALKGAVARHLDRFAFREAPLPFDWR